MQLTEEILAWTTVWLNQSCVYQIQNIFLSQKTVATYGLKGEVKLPT